MPFERSTPEPMRGFLRIGRVTGIPVSVHWTLAVIAWFLGMGLATGALPASVPDASTAAYWATASVGVVAFFLSILAHELSHALVARRFGVDTDGIELWLLGGMARLNRDSPSPKADGLIAAAGPAASLVIAGVFIGGAFGLDALGTWPLRVALVGWLGIVNLIIAVFNLLPGAPLDGGRILRAVRWARHHDRLRATTEAAQAGQILGWAIVILGLWMMLRGWGGFFLPLTGGFLIISARAEQLAAVTESRLSGITVADVTWYGVAEAAADTDAETMLGQRGRLGAPRVVAVQDGRGRPDRPGGRGPALAGSRATAAHHPPGSAHGALQPDGTGRAARGTGAGARPGHLRAVLLHHGLAR